MACQANKMACQADKMACTAKSKPKPEQAIWRGRKPFWQAKNIVARKWCQFERKTMREEGNQTKVHNGHRYTLSRECAVDKLQYDTTPVRLWSGTSLMECQKCEIAGNLDVARRRARSTLLIVLKREREYSLERHNI
ncbi:hypothetical protein C8R45DRAFT_923049 [Mycena sanguinolenta]|nr:hypothetical protein C8R45DRAFT_923049 [Mycena sanguinolenta]